MLLVGELQAVHDVTVAYPKSLVQAETRLFHGEVPEEVHFHIKRYSIDEVRTIVFSYRPNLARQYK